MLTISVTSDIDQALRGLQDLERGIPYAIAAALTMTAHDVRKAEEREIRTVFDRPTPFVQRAVRVWGATKTKQEATVWLKDSGARPEHFLLPQVEGGGRPLKRFEERLVRAGLMQANERAVPGAAAQLDAYGNLSRGQIVKILSQLQTAAVVGDFSDASNSKRSKAKRASVQYFVSKGPSGPGRKVFGKSSDDAQQHLPRGVWERRRFAFGSSVRPVLLFVRGVSYSKRWDYFGLADRVAREAFPRNMEQAVQRINARFSQQGGR